MSIWKTIKEMFFGAERIKDQLEEIVKDDVKVVKKTVKAVNDQITDAVTQIKKPRKKKS